MFFILSKTLNFLTMPLAIITVCFVLAGVLRSPIWKKRLFWSALSMLLFFSNDFIANELMLAWEIPATPFADVKKKYEWGIVLTGVTSGWRTPHDRVYFQRGADRVTHTVQLYKEGFIRKILVSGGSGRIVKVDEPEADELKKALLLMGVKEEDIYLENESRNTYESAVAIKKMYGATIKPEDCLLITSSFHMRRSLACFRKAGMEMDTFTTDFYSHPRHFGLDSLLIPTIDAMIIWSKLIKEWVGFIAYSLAGYI